MKQEEGNFERIQIISSDDEKLKILGELLSNKSSRDIIKLLIEKEMYTNEIAHELNLRVNLVIHHLKKLEMLGLVEIAHKTFAKNGNKHRYFKINSYFFLAPNENSDNLLKKGILKNLFKRGIKFMMIATAGVISWWTGNFIVEFQDGTINSNADISKPILEAISDSGLVPIIISQLIVILLTVYIIKKKEK